MDAMDRPNPRWSLLHLARPSQLTPHGHHLHDPLLHRSTGRLRRHLRYHSFRLEKISRDTLGAHRRRGQLRRRAHAARVLLHHQILHRRRAVVHGGDGHRMHPTGGAHPLPAVGEHVPAAVQERQAHGGELLLRRVERGGEGDGLARRQPQVRREQPVGARAAPRDRRCSHAGIHPGARVARVRTY